MLLLKRLGVGNYLRHPRESGFGRDVEDLRPAARAEDIFQYFNACFDQVVRRADTLRGKREALSSAKRQRRSAHIQQFGRNTELQLGYDCLELAFLALVHSK